MQATIEDALAAARAVGTRVEVPWDTATIGIFGETRTRTEVPIDGDRIEVYRPLRIDPRERRRERVQATKGKRSGRR